MNKGLNKGDYFTVVRWINQQDNSYVGTVLRVVDVDGGVVCFAIDGGQRTIMLHQVEIQKLSDSFAEKATGSATAGVELRIDARWRWTYTNMGENRISEFEPSPCSHPGNGFAAPCGDSWPSPFINDLGEPADSLHQIIDGKLVKYIDVPGDMEKVIVGNGDTEHRRYSAGRLTKNGRNLLCYSDGSDKWSHSDVTQWSKWRRPTTEELEES